MDLLIQAERQTLDSIWNKLQQIPEPSTLDNSLFSSQDFMYSTNSYPSDLPVEALDPNFINYPT